MGYRFSFWIAGMLVSWLLPTKSELEHRLNASEIVLALCGFLLAFGAIGEYLEEHKRLPLWLKWPKLVFIVLVVISLIGEFVGDAGVFVFSRKLQEIEGAEIQALDAKASAAREKADAASRIADHAAESAGRAEASARTALEYVNQLQASLPNRILTQAQGEAITNRLKPFAPRDIDVFEFAAYTDVFNDVFHISGRIVAAIREAHWKVTPWIPRQSGMMGIIVSVRPGSDKSTNDAADALVSALREQRIFAKRLDGLSFSTNDPWHPPMGGLSGDAPPWDEKRATNIRILIGMKPDVFDHVIPPKPPPI